MNEKTIPILLVILAVSSLVLVGSSYAQSVPKPSVPEFSLKVVAHSYDVPPTYRIDQYTGKNVTVQSGYHVENKSIEITIKNQPFNPYEDVDGKRIALFYNISVKGHHEEAWNYCFNNPYRGLLNASDGDYTIVTMPIGFHLEVPLGGYPLEGVDSGDQVDFRVSAQIGYYEIVYSGMFGPGFTPDFYYIFSGEASDWSNIQTLTIAAPTESPLSTATNTWATWQSEIVIGVAVLVVLTIGVSLLYLKRQRQREHQNILQPTD